MIGGELQTKIHGSHKGMINVSRRIRQSTNAPIKRLWHSNSGIRRLGHTNGAGGGKNNLISEI